jgi:predicted dienelactone hydrolase
MTLALYLLLAQAQYDPLKIPSSFKPTHTDITLKDAERKRDLPIRVYLPESKKPQPVVIFSHGLGGARTNNAYLGNHFAARGYVVVFTQHIGSDESVWQGVPMRERMSAMKRAASAQNLQLRVQDIHFLLTQLNSLNAKNPTFKGRFDLNQIGMSGHSFGAGTTQAVSGQTYSALKEQWTDQRIDAAIMYSPSYPARGSDKAFASVAIPWLLMTGTEDGSPISDTSPESRTKVFPALKPGNKYEVNLFEAEHNAFGERALPGETGNRNPNHHKVILGVSTAFWDAFLRQDSAAKAWLNGKGPRSIMEPKDTWKKK